MEQPPVDELLRGTEVLDFTGVDVFKELADVFRELVDVFKELA